MPTRTPKTQRRSTHAITRQEPRPLPRPEPGRETTLIAVCGNATAILTETVWALAQEDPPVLPMEVQVITTTRGRSDLERDLLTPRPDWGGQSVWQSLRRLVLGPDCGRDPRLTLEPPEVLSAPDPGTGGMRLLDDVRNRDDNTAAAEFITRRVRSVTDNPDRRLVASIAGGRKTMGTLLHAVISLLGRRGDRITHVLVNEPFDDARLHPRFYFRGQPGGPLALAGRDGSPPRSVDPASARIELTDVPFVPLSGLFERQIGRLPGGFMNLVRTVNGLLDDEGHAIAIQYDRGARTAYFDGVPMELSGRDVPFFEFLLLRTEQQLPPFPQHRDAIPMFLEFLRVWMPANPQVNLSHGETDWRNGGLQLPDDGDLRKRLLSLRSRFTHAGLGHLISILIPPHRPLGFPNDRVRVTP